MLLDLVRKTPARRPLPFADVEFGLDQVDYHEPTMVIVGTRGLKKVKGMLLGSVSNYLLQKSSSPVMVRFAILFLVGRSPDPMLRCRLFQGHASAPSTRPNGS